MEAGDWFDDKYRLEHVLGRGASGEVWIARDASGGALVIKRLRKAADREQRARFVRELAVARALGPPHFPELVSGSASESGGPCFIVWRDVAGALLPAWAEQRPGFAEKLEVIGGALEALSVLHAAGVVHRDLKPEHLLVSGAQCVVLLDLGLCRVDGSDRLTASRHLLGSAPFVAPEQLSAPHGVDARADLYSLGAIAFWLFAGRPPFWAPTAEALMGLKLLRDAPRLSDYSEADVPDALDDWVARLLERDPTRRPASAAEARRSMPLDLS